MRIVVVIAAATVAAAFVFVPAAAQACSVSAKIVSVEYAAAKKKPIKVVKKTRKPKVEYMRIAP